MATVTLRNAPSSPRTNRKNVRRVPFGRIKQAAGRLSRKFIADENPDEKERARQKRIDNIMHDVVLLEAMRRWELENKNQRSL